MCKFDNIAVSNIWGTYENIERRNKWSKRRIFFFKKKKKPIGDRAGEGCWCAYYCKVALTVSIRGVGLVKSLCNSNPQRTVIDMGALILILRVHHIIDIVIIIIHDRSTVYFCRPLYKSGSRTVCAPLKFRLAMGMRRRAPGGHIAEVVGFQGSSIVRHTSEPVTYCIRHC